MVAVARLVPLLTCLLLVARVDAAWAQDAQDDVTALPTQSSEAHLPPEATESPHQPEQSSEPVEVVSSEENVAPSVVINPSRLDISPYPGMTKPHDIDVSVTDLNGVTDLERVDLCLFYWDPETKDHKSTSPHANGECRNEDLNPANQIRLTWTRSTNEFSVQAAPDSAPTHWQVRPRGDGDQDSKSDYGTLGSNLSLKFAFIPSEVMREAKRVVLEEPRTPDDPNKDQPRWRVRAVAFDAEQATGTSSDDDLVSIAVGHYSGIQANRAPQKYGHIEAGSSGVSANDSVGTLVSNGPSKVYVGLNTDFIGSKGDYVLRNAFRERPKVDQPPKPGFFAMDCNAGASFDAATAVRIPTAPSQAVLLVDDVTPTGTDEAGVTTVTSSCRLSNGGIDAPSGVTFSAGVLTASTG